MATDISYYDKKLEQAFKEIELLKKRIKALEKDKQQMLVVLASDKTITVPICLCGRLNCKILHSQEEIEKNMRKLNSI